MAIISISFCLYRIYIYIRMHCMPHLRGHFSLHFYSIFVSLQFYFIWLINYQWWLIAFLCFRLRFISQDELCTNNYDCVSINFNTYILMLLIFFQIQHNLLQEFDKSISTLSVFEYFSFEIKVIFKISLTCMYYFLYIQTLSIKKGIMNVWCFYAPRLSWRV